MKTLPKIQTITTLDEQRANPLYFVKDECCDRDKYTAIVSLLVTINKNRAANPTAWTEIGRILYRLYEGSQPGLDIWTKWSRRSYGYVQGRCESWWKKMEVTPALEDFTSEEALKALRDIAEQDKKSVKVRPAPRFAKPRDYIAAYHALGYSFTKNDMNDRIYANGKLMTDGISDLIMTELGNNGYTSAQVFQRAYGAEAEKHRFHPIKDYLSGLKWDRQDNIGKLVSYFTDEVSMFGLLIRKWMIGAVSKVMNPTPTEQNPMLVLAGAQGLGKSVFVHWLGNVLPEYFISSAIYPDNKDFIINSASNFVWEVKELGGTIRKADIEALKAFLDTPYASYRTPYGKYEVKKFVTASFIGTINFDGNGFLNDPTGHRRFRVCQLAGIDHGYYTELDPNQLWAQAVTLYKAGETYKLGREDEAKICEINDRYVVDDPISEDLVRYFDIDKSKSDWFTSTNEMLRVLKNVDILRDALDRGSQMRVSTALVKLGISPKQRRIQGRPVRGWVGVRVKEQYRTFRANLHDIPR